MTLDWIDGVSIRETEELEKRSIDTKKIATDIIQHFLRHAVRDGFFSCRYAPRKYFCK
jgi:Predicted unusual protein kinase